MKWQEHYPWAGVFPATLCPFHEDESIDEEGLRAYMRELASVDGVKGLVCNGHTGEITSLRPSERECVTTIVAEEVKGKVKVVSGVSAEGNFEAIDYAIAAKEVGDDARRITGCVSVALVKPQSAFFRTLPKGQTSPPSSTNILPGRRQAIASRKCWNL